MVKQKLTATERKLLEALDKAVEIYQYASMTVWERVATEDDRKKVEAVLDKYKHLLEESNQKSNKNEKTTD